MTFVVIRNSKQSVMTIFSPLRFLWMVNYLNVNMLLYCLYVRQVINLDFSNAFAFQNATQGYSIQGLRLQLP